MKKIIFSLLLFLCIYSVKADYKFSTAKKLSNMFVYAQLQDKVHDNALFLLKRDDGEFVYCINPFQRINETDYYNEYDYNNEVFNLTHEQLNRMNLIAHFGYGYKNHTDLKWYGVSQYLIWEVLNLDELYFMDKKSGNKIIAYKEEINEINSLIDNYYKLPSFSNKTFNFTIDSEYTLLDLNSMLSNYSIKESNIDSKIIDNYVVINTKDEGNFEIEFERKENIDNDYVLYDLDGSQGLLYPGKVDSVTFKINIIVTTGSITINKKDSEGINRKFANLMGAKYGIYKDDNLIKEIETNEFGTAYIDNLKLGNYIVKELYPSEGYNIDENIYEVSLTYENKDAHIESLESVIKGNIIFNKYFGIDNDYEFEDKAIFEIYDINDNLIGSYETMNGVLKETLDYGDYYAIQAGGINGYSYVDKFEISIRENREYSYDLYDNLLVVDVPDTSKNDLNISEMCIMLGILFIFKSIKFRKDF